MYETCAVRPARTEDRGALIELEILSAGRYRGTAVSVLADSPPRPQSLWDERLSAGDVLVAALPSSRLLGFAMLRDLEARLFVEELAVLPNATGAHVEDRLLDAAARTAADRDAAALVVAGCRNVPWSAPYLLCLGFRALDESEVEADAELFAIRRAETASGLPPHERVFLTRAV